MDYEEEGEISGCRPLKHILSSRKTTRKTKLDMQADL